MSDINFNNIKFYKSFATIDQLEFLNLPEVVIVGKSNVGKSSLLNKLCNNKNLARISSTPGKTITINFYTSKEIALVDLPGYGFAKRSSKEISRWSSSIDEYFNQGRNLNLVICLIDIRHDPTEQDIQMINFIENLGLPFAIVATKADKISKQKQSATIAKLQKALSCGEHVPFIAVSSLNNTGIAELKKLIQISISR